VRNTTILSKPSRRDVIIGLASTAFIPRIGIPVHAETGRDLLAYVGCRTTKERNARGDGISVYRIDGTTGAWRPIQLLRDLVNPSYLAFDRHERNLYAVHGDFGEVSAFSIAPKTGQIAFINRQDCGGKNPVHLTPDQSNRFMLVANYATGNLSALPIATDGSLGALAAKIEVPGEPGPHKTQQKGIQPHHIPYDPSGRFLVVPDKGGDQVAVFRFDPDKPGFIANEPPFVKARDGAGCRHIAFHPVKPMAYVANELDSTVTAYAWDGTVGRLQARQILPTTPENFTQNSTAAGIAAARDGRTVYVSNRGHDSIAVFTVDQETGLLRIDSWASTEGKQPRFFALDPTEQFLYAANENSDTIVEFKIDSTSGRILHTGQVIRSNSPTCIVFKKV
jgi:6-phosphogluconolactonase